MDETNMTDKTVENGRTRHNPNSSVSIAFDGFPKVTERSILDALGLQKRHWLSKMGSFFRTYRQIYEQYPLASDGSTHVLPIATTGQAMKAICGNTASASHLLEKLISTGCLARVVKSFSRKRHIPMKYAYNDKAAKTVLRLCRRLGVPSFAHKFTPNPYYRPGVTYV